MTSTNTDELNIFMSLTMLSFFIPCWVENYRGNYVTSTLITISATASAVYHLHESQKHQLQGYSEAKVLNSAEWNQILINIDRVAAITLGIWKYIHLSTNINYYMIRDGIIALLLMTISETVYRHNCWEYIVTHTLWHFMAAYMLSVY